MIPVRTLKSNLLLRPRKKSFQTYETYWGTHDGWMSTGLPPSRHENALRQGVTDKIAGETAVVTVSEHRLVKHDTASVNTIQAAVPMMKILIVLENLYISGSRAYLVR
jgi:hypothetical protein